MKVEQKQDFNPITITIETKEEADVFMQLLKYCSSKRQGACAEMGTRLECLFDILLNKGMKDDC